jgi:FAD/FMN-containing dehydrogenase
VNTATFDALQQHLRAPLVTRSHHAYEDARRVWNGMIDRRPLVIAQPESTPEVAAAVRFAREHGLPLSVKGGGHGVAGPAICEDGLVIDLCRMHAAHVDPAAQTATVQGGARLRALDAASQAHGLATTAGIYRETGVAGLMLGGGLGLLMRRYGLTCDNLLAAEVVTADGQVLEASEWEHPDLFWALRGGGGNFGVVTRMDFQLHPLTYVVGGRITYDFADAADLGKVFQEVLAGAPDEVQVYMSYGIEEGGAKTASVTLCHCGAREAGEAVAERFRRFGQPLEDDVTWRPYLRMQQHWDESFPTGILTFWKSNFLATISDDALRVCQDAIRRQSLPGCGVDLEPMGGAVARVAPGATAFADRDAASTLLITSGWRGPHESDARIAWVRETWGAVQAFTKPSAYVNYLDRGDEDRMAAVFGPNYQRLVAVKRIYDPDNVFCHNANIRP